MNKIYPVLLTILLLSLPAYAVTPSNRAGSTHPKSTVSDQQSDAELHKIAVALQDELENSITSIDKNWVFSRQDQSPANGLELLRTDKPIVVSGILYRDGQFYNVTIDESSEPSGGISITVADPEQRDYLQRMNGYYRQNHMIVDASAKTVLESLHLAPFSGTLASIGNSQGLVNGYKITYAFHIDTHQVEYTALEPFYGSKQDLVKTYTAPIPIVYMSRPTPPLSPFEKQQQAQNQQTQAMLNQQFQEAQRTQRAAQIQTGVMGVLSPFLMMLRH